MTALMPIRKGPYEQEKFEERALVAREKAGMNPISQRDGFRKDPNRTVLRIRKYFFESGSANPRNPDLQINYRSGRIRILPGHVCWPMKKIYCQTGNLPLNIIKYRTFVKIFCSIFDK
jgi:hypothetical protein